MTTPEDVLDLAIGPTFKDELIAMLREHSALAPRSQQQALGPSEIGHPCDRKLALGLTGAPKHNSDPGDPLPSMAGTKLHEGMEEMLRGYNERNGTRFLVEQRVYPAPGFGGTMDAFDLRTGTVIDWKFPGASRMTAYRKSSDPGVIYRTQAHLYGLGATNMGLDVNRVRLVFLPRGGFSTGAHVWEEPYDEALARAALERMWGLIGMSADLKVDELPERYGLFPISPLMCEYCPFFAREPDAPTQCAGV